MPFASVESVRLERSDLVVQLRSGREIAWHGGRWKEPFPVLRAMADRIDRGLRAHRANVASEMVAHLARGSRSIAAWLADLRRASDPDRSTYRVATLPPDELWKTVENASAPPTARAGAAVALERILDDRGKRRLRDVAATCASEKLRLALEAAASESRVEERLAALVD